LESPKVFFKTMFIKIILSEN